MGSIDTAVRAVVNAWGSGQFKWSIYADGERGRMCGDAFETVRDGQIGQGGALTSVEYRAEEGDGWNSMGRSLLVLFALQGEAAMLHYSVTGPQEAEVIGVAQLLDEAIAEATAQVLPPSTSAPLPATSALLGDGIDPVGVRPSTSAPLPSTNDDAVDHASVVQSKWHWLSPTTLPGAILAAVVAAVLAGLILALIQVG